MMEITLSSSKQNLLWQLICRKDFYRRFVQDRAGAR
jgi:hypothetical protein